MDSFDTANLIYLTILGTVLAAGFFAANRQKLSQSLQQAAIWFFIFIGMVLVYGVWDDVSQTVVPRQSVAVDGDSMVVEVPRAFDGHYHMVLEVNGAPIRFVVDTGATDLVLTKADAEAAGLDPESLRYLGRAFTANGEVATADVRLDQVALGDVVDRNVRAVVNEGEMFQSLLGMSYLQKFGRIEIEGDRLRLVR